MNTLIRFVIDELRIACERNRLTQKEARRLVLIIKEYLAKHWTEDENPAHEVMEAVCS